MPHALTTGTFPPPSLSAGHATVGTPVAQQFGGGDRARLGVLYLEEVRMGVGGN